MRQHEHVVRRHLRHRAIHVPDAHRQLLHNFSLPLQRMPAGQKDICVHFPVLRQNRLQRHGVREVMHLGLLVIFYCDLQTPVRGCWGLLGGVEAQGKVAAAGLARGYLGRVNGEWDPGSFGVAGGGSIAVSGGWVERVARLAVAVA